MATFQSGHDMENGSLPRVISCDEKACASDIFSFESIGYTVNGRKKILKEVSGYAQAGDFVALMGSSGCGKTSLLNILANRTSGSLVSGSIRLNGRSLTRSDFRSATTFVEQEDALIGSLTVEETIYYSSKLSLPDMSVEERSQRIEQALMSFGLESVKNVKIGTPLQKGCSGGQKRRISVACQLISLPRVVFLDEPTSGLDSAAAFEICSKIKNIAQLNHLIVIASVHQPSTSTFNLFNKVLLLSKGHQLFFGSRDDIQPYFDTSSFPISPSYNPADHMLDISNIDFYEDKEAGLEHIKNLAEHWKDSLYARQLGRRLGRIEEPSLSTSSHNAAGRYSKSLFYETYVLVGRSLRKAVRDPLAYGVRLVMYLGLAIMMGTVWLRLSASQHHIQEFITALFFGSAFMSFMAVAYIPAYLEDYSSYVKEHRNGICGPAAFVLSNIVISIPFLYLITIVFSLVTYFMINFRHSATGFFHYTLWLFLDLLAAESLVVLISTLAPLFVAALALTAFANGLWMSVGGFLVAQDVLNVFWYYTFFQIDYQRYVFDGLMQNEFLFRNYSCAADCSCLYSSSLASQCKIAGSVVLTHNGIGTSPRTGINVAILLAIAIFMRLATYVILRLKK